MCRERKSLKRTKHGETGPERARDLWLCWQCTAQPATVKAMWSTGFTGVVSIPRTGGIDTTPWMNALSGHLTSLAMLWLFSVVLAYFTWRDQIFFPLFFPPLPPVLCSALTWQSTWGDYMGYPSGSSWLILPNLCFIHCTAWHRSTTAQCV